MISQLMVLVLSHNLHAYMVKPPAEQKPEMAADGTRIVELMAYDELVKRSPEEIEAYLERARKSILYYEEHVGQYFPDGEGESAKLHLDWRRLMQSIVIDEAEAAPFSPDTFGRAKDSSVPPSKPDKNRKTVPAAVKAPAAAAVPPPKTPKIPGFKPADFDPNRLEDFRCFYAGWPVTKPKCVGESSVEYTYAEGFTKQTSTTTLSCKGGQTLCNPIVFGVAFPKKRSLASVKVKNTPPAKVSLKPEPVCVSSAAKRNLSKACYWKARDLKATVDIEHNRELYSKFKAGWDNMCKNGVTKNQYYAGRDQAIKEMKNTCSWISAAMNGDQPDDKMRKSDTLEGTESTH